jgi:hypothetical protein
MARSNATKGTKQIWIELPLHAYIDRLATEDGRTIRMTAERKLLEALGFKNMQELIDSEKKRNKTAPKAKTAA